MPNTKITVSLDALTVEVMDAIQRAVGANRSAQIRRAVAHYFLSQEAALIGVMTPSDKVKARALSKRVRSIQ